jgi:hypothetical protein
MKARAYLSISLVMVLFLFCGQVLAQWTIPVPLTELNTSAQESGPWISNDGLTIYFQRWTDHWRLYHATRSNIYSYFTNITPIYDLNTYSENTSYAWVSPDGLRMYYTQSRKLRIATRASVDSPWSPGSYIDELNTISNVEDCKLSDDERTIVFGALSDIGTWDMYIASRPNKNVPFGNIRNLTELNTISHDNGASLTADGLRIYFYSDRNGQMNVYTAVRSSINEPFGSLEIIPLFTGFCQPRICMDGATMLFVKTRPNWDIYVSYATAAYVDAVNGSDNNTGRSPEQAFVSIQKCIDSVADGYTVVVYPGIYPGTIDFKGKAITIKGFAGQSGAPVLVNPTGTAVRFAGNEGPDSILKNFIIKNSVIGISIERSSPTISNLTLVDNHYGITAMRTRGAQPDISNCIFWNNIEGDLVGCRADYSCTVNRNSGLNNILADPLFVDPNNGDYHLRSERGRYWPEHNVWVLDTVTSPCIDAGDPNDDPSDEPLPNGGRINMGAYGGTRYASMREKTNPYPDVNGDGVINLSDLSELIDQWLQATGWHQ